MVNILVGGDVCPIRRSMPYFHQGDAPAMFNDLMPDFEDADLTIQGPTGSYARAMDFWGLSGKVDGALGWACAASSRQPNYSTRNGPAWTVCSAAGSASFN